MSKSRSGKKTLIELKNVSRTYKLDKGVEVHALRNVNLTIKQGDMIAIMGQSGSGKSTLMNLLGLLDQPSDGRYYLKGRNVSTLKDDDLALLRNREIGFVFQSYNLIARTSAVENVELPMIYARRKDMRRKAEAVLKDLGLGGRLTHKPSELSGGEQQRVAIARALINEPSLILADEPTGNLDSKSGREIMTILKNLNRKGITIILVTHEPHIARYARRTIRFMDGRMVS